MWPAQIGRNKRRRDARRRSSAADADSRPGGGGANSSARQARTNTQAHAVGETMPHPGERRGKRREGEVPPRDTGWDKRVVDRTLSEGTFSFLLFFRCEIYSRNNSTKKLCCSMLSRASLIFETLSESEASRKHLTWMWNDGKCKTSSIWGEPLKSAPLTNVCWHQLKFIFW